MAISNHERVGKALDLLREGLRPFIERELRSRHGGNWVSEVKAIISDTRLGGTANEPMNDAAALLVIMDRAWSDVFRNTLGKAERSLVNELLDVRNRWAHQNPFSSDDADRALDSAARLLTAISAPQSDDVAKMKMELRRVIFDEQMRSEKRRAAGTAIESQVAGNLKPWREVITPHRDVASGRYQQAEFAADLWQVHLGEGSDEYLKPAEFFRRTYLTESLKHLLKGALQRLSAAGGDPVVQLQTNFGGGKTHSMLALYHLFSGASPGELLGIDAVLKDAGVTKVPTGVKRVVLVGNKISPGNPVRKPDGTVIRTLWGELAWQLGGKAAFTRIKADDEKATSPGDALRELMNTYGPCLILIDEWVAYARQLHDNGELPGGNFETHFTFAQALTEAAKGAKQCLLVVSLPASDTSASPHAQADDEEVGGLRGRTALARLRNVIGRVEASWTPASTEEGFQIVRRRLFEPITEKFQYVARDTIARAFYDLYRTQQQEFPPECRDLEYETRLKAAYPVHPYIFYRLYTDWSTLVKFQRTRGVLRLMAAVIHSLWEKGDRNPLILPATIAIDDPRVRDELTRYLPDTWKPVIEKDVDGPNALPLRIDGEVPNLGKFHACRRVARTIYLGSAPTATAANRGLEDRRVKLGCVMPGESPAVFGDALRRLSGAATYLYQDGPRYWYSTQPTVTKLAEDRMEQLKRDADRVVQEMDQRLREDLRSPGAFRKIHPMPLSSADVPDDTTARLVVLGVDYPFSKEAGNKAQAAATALLESRGNTPRLFRNTLVFLAVDETRLQDLDEAVRRYLAWKSIVEEKLTLNLDPQQAKQAEEQMQSANGTVKGRLPEAYQWLLVPAQASPQSATEWHSYRLNGQDGLAVRASNRLRSEELLVPTLAGTRLRIELDRVPLWRGDHVAIKQLAEDFATYTYLPRLSDSHVLEAAVSDGLGLLLWSHESFAYADSFDEVAGRYRGLRCGQQSVIVSADGNDGLVVKPAVALKQQADESAANPPEGSGGGAIGEKGPVGGGVGNGGASGGKPPKPRVLKRFHGTVKLDSERVGRDAGRVAEEVIAHLEGLVGSEVTVTLEIDASIPEGAPDNVVRIVTENSRALNFTAQGFEEV
jgi:predicted AAA+ superfamily ATPase